MTIFLFFEGVVKVSPSTVAVKNELLTLTHITKLLCINKLGFPTPGSSLIRLLPPVHQLFGSLLVVKGLLPFAPPLPATTPLLPKELQKKI
jgi:hypothetical protein